MFVKEWWDMRWKFLITVVLVAIPVALICAFYLPPYESAGRAVSVFPKSIAMEQISNVYSGGGIALGFLAAFLGATLVSGEASRDTMLFLISKPVSRTRIMLTKYAVCASVLLVVAVLGHALLLIVAAVKGYPLLSLLSVSGVVLSTVLLWLGSLFVLGAALVVSVTFRDSTISIAVASLVAVAYWFTATLGLSYWSSDDLYAGQSIVSASFVICLVAATISLLAALWLFNRRTY